jgi:hypothetical protein
MGVAGPVRGSISGPNLAVSPNAGETACSPGDEPFELHLDIPR